MAAGEIQLSTNTPFYINKKDQFLLDRVEETVEYFLGSKKIVLPIKNIKNLNIENSLKIENFKLKIIYTSGHSPGGCSYYFPQEKIVFTGDTLFKRTIGRCDFSYCSKKDLDTSLKKLFKLPGETIVYPGHGEKTTIQEELFFHS